MFLVLGTVAIAIVLIYFTERYNLASPSAKMEGDRNLLLVFLDDVLPPTWKSMEFHPPQDN